MINVVDLILTDDEVKYFNSIDLDYDEIIHYCLNWCFHSRPFWISLIEKGFKKKKAVRI